MAKAKKHRPTKTHLRERIDELLRIKLDGAAWWDIREYVHLKEQEEGSPWKLGDGEAPLSDSQIRRYTRKADDLIAESCRESREKLIRRHLAQRRHLYAKAVESGDIRSALAVARDEAQLEGLYDPPDLPPPETGKDLMSDLEILLRHPEPRVRLDAMKMKYELGRAAELEKRLADLEAQQGKC